MGAGYNFLLIPSWTRRGRDCLFPNRLKRSDKILQAKISAKTWGVEVQQRFPSEQYFPCGVKLGTSGAGMRARWSRDKAQVI